MSYLLTLFSNWIYYYPVIERFHQEARMKWKTYAAAAALIATVLILVLIFSGGNPPVTGRYILKVNGRYTGTTASITESETGILVEMHNGSSLSARYALEKQKGNIYSILDTDGSGTENIYTLKRGGGGFEGTAEILPVGKVKVRFEREEEQPKTESFQWSW